MQNWDAAWLTPFQALRLIVSKRYSDHLAESLPDFQIQSRLKLAHSGDAGKAGREAFAAAEKDLMEWCLQGLIEGYGFAARTAFDPEVRESLAQHWTLDRQFRFEEDGLIGRPYFRRVTLKRADLVVQILPRRRRGAAPKYDWDVVEAAFLDRVSRDDWPESMDNEQGWRTKADVVRFVADLLSERSKGGDEVPSNSSIKAHVDRMFDKHRP